jgi:hypothetical protein
MNLALISEEWWQLLRRPELKQGCRDNNDDDDGYRQAFHLQLILPNEPVKCVMHTLRSSSNEK